MFILWKAVEFHNPNRLRVGLFSRNRMTWRHQHPYIIPRFPFQTRVYVTKPIIHQRHILLQTQGLALQWRTIERDGVSNHRCLCYLLNRLFVRRSKKTSKLRVTDLCDGNTQVTGDFPAYRASEAENVSIGWRHHGTPITRLLNIESYKWPFWLLSSMLGWYSWMNHVPDKTDSITLR